MAEKSFGVKEINLIGASGTPTIESPNNLNLNAVNVAISTNVSIGGTLTVTGNVSIGGTFTYEDVTNIDSVGIITARSDIKVGTGVTLTPAGAGFFSGIVTASNFVKRDGSSLGGFSQDAQGNLLAGTNAGSSLDGSSAEYNILLGENAGESIDGDDNNIAIGYDAGKNNTASSNIFIGRDAAKALSSSLSSQNIFIGHEAVSNKASVSGTVVGAQAGIGNGTGINLTLFGYRAGGNSYNSTTFIGHQAGRSATSACDFTTAVGSNALYNNAGRGNVAIGNLSGQVLTSGKFNTLAGYMAGRGGLSGTINYTDCVAIGSSVAVDLSSANNVIVIGANANPSSNTVTNEITLGNANITKFRIPGINVVLKDNGGTPTEGHVLTVDGSGEASFVGITTSSPVTNFVVTANGSSAYRFAGGGVDASEDNPDLFLEKGVKYRFDNTTGSSHPFAFRVSNGGSAYTNGITGSQNGVQFFTVPYDAPDVLAYQCTVHSGMLGNIWTYAKTTQCYDIYRLAANYTIPASNTTVTETMVRPTLFFEKIGPGMSVSSGVFTFPSTGKYEIQAFFQGFQSNGNDNIFKFNMDATADNSNWQEVVNCREGNYDSGRAFSATFTYLIDITNTSTHKVRFGTTTAGSNRVQLDGNGASNILDGTYFVFKKILNT